jgi:hypothetical protein
VQILTKGDETAQRDFDLLDGNDSFGVTFTGADKYEPGAAPNKTRHLNLCVAKGAHGIGTWMSLEPVLSPGAVFAAIKSFDLVDVFRIGKLNYVKTDFNWSKFGHVVEALCQERGRTYHIKDDLRRDMEKDNEKSKIA